VKSDYTHNFYDIVQPGVANRDKYLIAVAKTTAQLHECGFLHKDYSAGNILLRELEDGTIRVEIIDLNRIRFRKISLDEGCKNFERLPVTEGTVEVLAEAYATERGFDKRICYELIEKYTPYKL
jgi:aminoglycoside/choline kinase family phosphotransferase